MHVHTFWILWRLVAHQIVPVCYKDIHSMTHTVCTTADLRKYEYRDTLAYTYITLYFRINTWL